MRERLHRSERLSSLGELAAGVAHEIRNPLNAIGMAAQRLQREYGEAAGEKDSFEKLTGVIRDETRRLNGIIEGFLGLSRRRLSLRRGSAARLLGNVIELIRDEASGRSLFIEQQREGPDTFVYMDEDKMKQALLNIARNAMDAADRGGSVRFSLEKSGRDHLSITVHDTGPGISPEDLRQIFNPHFSTKEKGLGLGLPIAYEIVRAHGGDIRVRSRPGEGTAFEIVLPLERKVHEES
jgi:signal transduction histidine kinase